jgi:tetratricopeptide (TPR) repeat protein
MLRSAVDLKTRALFGMLAGLVAATSASAQNAPVASPGTPAPSTPPPSTPITAPPTAPSSAAPAAPGQAPASATPAAEPSLEAKERARVAYARGQEAFSQGQYEPALAAFQEAFAAVPNATVLRSIAEVQTRLGQVPAASESLRKYLELAPDAPDRAELEAKLAALSTLPAIVYVASNPAGAELTIDGAPVPGEGTSRTPAQLELAPGQHVLEYSLAGYESGRETLTLQPGTRQELTITLRALAPPAPPAVVRAPEPVKRPERPTAALWITGSLGAAGIITGTVLGFLALNEQSDYDSNPTEAGADRGERLALFADVGFGVGAMALTTAAVLYFSQDDAPGDAPPSDPIVRARAKPATAKLQLIPQLSPTSAAATARLTF